MTTSVFDSQIIGLNNEILALKQSKLKNISQVKFVNTVIENVEVISYNTKRFYIEPANDVFPLLTYKIQFVTSDIEHTWPRPQLYLRNGKFWFGLSNDSNSPTPNNKYNIIFTSTSELIITEA